MYYQVTRRPARTAADIARMLARSAIERACASEARIFMRHFSCDLCGKDMTPGSDARYVVRMEIFPAGTPEELTEADLDQDQIEAMAEMLAELEERQAAGEPPPVVPSRRSLEYDLCPTCYRKFAADPLGRERARKPHFSKN